MLDAAIENTERPGDDNEDSDEVEDRLPGEDEDESMGTVEPAKQSVTTTDCNLAKVEDEVEDNEDQY